MLPAVCLGFVPPPPPAALQYTAAMRLPPPPEGSPVLKILTWNVAGLRALVKKVSPAQSISPCIIDRCLQAKSAVMRATTGRDAAG